MIKKMFLFVCALMIQASVFAETGVEISTGGPKLLWQKEFDRDITSVAVSSDGARIALTLGTELVKEEKDEKYFKGIKRTYGSGKLIYLDNKGNILWEYEHEKEKGMSMLRDVKMSDNGRYVSCSVWRVSERDTRTVGIMQEWKTSGTLFFNSEGELMWPSESVWILDISPDGMAFCYEWDRKVVSLFDKNGKKVWEGGTYIEVAAYEITPDGNLIIAGTKVYDRAGNVLMETPAEDIFFVSVSKNGKFALASKSYSELLIPEKLYCFDIESKKVLWETNEIDNMKVDNFDFNLQFNRGAITADEKYLILVGRPGAGIPKEVRVLDLHSGEVVSRWNTARIGEGSIHYLKAIGDSDILIKVGDGLYRCDPLTGDVRWFVQGYGYPVISDGKFLLMRKKDMLYFFECNAK